MYQEHQSLMVMNGQLCADQLKLELKEMDQRQGAY